MQNCVPITVSIDGLPFRFQGNDKNSFIRVYTTLRFMPLPSQDGTRPCKLIFLKRKGEEKKKYWKETLKTCNIGNIKDWTRRYIDVHDWTATHLTRNFLSRCLLLLISDRVCLTDSWRSSRWWGWKGRKRKCRCCCVGACVGRFTFVLEKWRVSCWDATSCN